MKRLMFGLLMVAAGTAMADDLGSADQALRMKDFGRAFPLYARLADAGNTEAQFRLGEMYWYGDGTAVDMAKSRAWLQKAATKGHAGARETLNLLAQRERRAADIAYWTTAYQGEDLTTGKNACPLPSIPAVSTQLDEVRTVGKAIGDWAICYKDFARDLQAAGPSINRIPADIRKLMTPAELAQAIGRIDTVVARIVRGKEDDAETFIAERANWYAATDRRLGQVRPAILKELMDHEYDFIHRPQSGYMDHRPGPFALASNTPAKPTTP